LAVIALVAVLLFGSNIRGTRGWFRLGSASFQPAEAAKAALIIFLGWLISRYGRRFDTGKFFIATGIAAGLLIGLILQQPDLGSAAVIFSIWFGLLFFAGVKKRYLIFLLAVLLAGFVAGWFFLFQDYQKDRLLIFFNPERDPLLSGYNITQSIIAVGSGQILGRGLGGGSQSQLHFLPEAQTDFIFSVIAEELGLVGATIVLVLFFVLLWRLTRIVRLAKSEFGAYTVLGIILFFLTQLVLNIGGAIGLVPITGVTLPMVSYGGSSLIICCLLLGVAESITRSELATKMTGAKI
jgi:rod shape determining protein RodA